MSERRCWQCGLVLGPRGNHGDPRSCVDALLERLHAAEARVAELTRELEVAANTLVGHRALLDDREARVAELERDIAKQVTRDRCLLNVIEELKAERAAQAVAIERAREVMQNALGHCSGTDDESEEELAERLYQIEHALAPALAALAPTAEQGRALMACVEALRRLDANLTKPPSPERIKAVDDALVYGAEALAALAAQQQPAPWPLKISPEELRDRLDSDPSTDVSFEELKRRLGRE